MLRVLAAAALAAVTLTACGGSGSAATAATPAQVAHQIGATSLHPYDHGPFARAAVSATWHGRSVVIAVFGSDAKKQAYVKMASAFAGPPLKSGPGYVVFSNSLG